MCRGRLTRRQLGGVLLSVAGVATVFLEDGLAPRGGMTAAVGNGLMLLTALCLAVHGVLANLVLARHPVLLVTAYSMAIGTLLLLPVALAEGLPGAVADIDGRLAALLLFLGVGGGALPHVLTAFALARLSPTQTAVYTNLNPLVATALAALFLEESITGTFALGFAAVIAGLLLVNWPRHAQTQRTGAATAKGQGEIP